MQDFRGQQGAAGKDRPAERGAAPTQQAVPVSPSQELQPSATEAQPQAEARVQPKGKPKVEDSRAAPVAQPTSADGMPPGPPPGAPPGPHPEAPPGPPPGAPPGPPPSPPLASAAQSAASSTFAAADPRRGAAAKAALIDPRRPQPGVSDPRLGAPAAAQPGTSQAPAPAPGPTAAIPSSLALPAELVALLGGSSGAGAAQRARENVTAAAQGSAAAMAALPAGLNPSSLGKLVSALGMARPPAPPQPREHPVLLWPLHAAIPCTLEQFLHTLLPCWMRYVMS